MDFKMLRTGAKTLALYGAMLGASGVQASEAEARALLKAMSDYVGGLTTIEIDVDTELEIVTPEMEKIGFDSSSKLRMARPNQARLERKGSFAEIDLLFDGKNLTIRERKNNVYGQIAAPGTTEDLVTAMHDELGMAVPGADLLLRDSYSVLVADVLEAKVLGQGVVGGQLCDHVAFRNFDTDWQLWIRTGPEKVPCKMVITSKLVGMAPQYTVNVRAWKGNGKFAPNAFVFTPAAGERQVMLNEIPQTDEAPTTPATGGRK